MARTGPVPGAQIRRGPPVAKATPAGTSSKTENRLDHPTTTTGGGRSTKLPREKGGGVHRREVLELNPTAAEYYRSPPRSSNKNPISGCGRIRHALPQGCEIDRRGRAARRSPDLFRVPVAAVPAEHPL